MAVETPVVSDGVYRSSCKMCHGGCGVLLREACRKVHKLNEDLAGFNMFTRH